MADFPLLWPERRCLDAAVSATEMTRDFDALFVTFDDQPGALVYGVKEGGLPPPDFFVGREVGAIACRVEWSPDERPTRRCWAAAAVALGGRPAAVGVGPYNREWFRIDGLDLPWFLASTAGGIRKALEHGEPMVIKYAKDERLFAPVVRGIVPPTDADGRI